MVPKMSQKVAKWRPKCIKKSMFGKGREKVTKRLSASTSKWTLLVTIFHQKSKKWHPKRHPKIDAEKVSKIYAKRLQNDAKMDAKIDDFSYFFEKGENARNYLFYNRKRGSGHQKMHEKSI